MEAVEDAALEPAIGWLADTILANLSAGGKLESWIRQAGLGNDIGQLKSEVEAVEMVVSAVHGRAAGNKPLARSLAAVKELLYDADDVVDELDCYRLQQELQPETMLETDGAQQVEISRQNADNVQSSRLRSQVWNQFEIIAFLEQNRGPTRARCKHCQTELMCETKKGHQFCAIISRAKLVATNVEQLTLLQAPLMLLQFLGPLQLVIRPAGKG